MHFFSSRQHFTHQNLCDSSLFYRCQVIALVFKLMPEQIWTFWSVYLAKKRVWALHSKKISTLEADPLIWGCMLMNFRGGPLFEGLYLDEFSHFFSKDWLIEKVTKSNSNTTGFDNLFYESVFKSIKPQHTVSKRDLCKSAWMHNKCICYFN